MLGTLIPCGGGDPVSLLRERLVVGRRSSCDIVLRYPNVSGRHCELIVQSGHWVVRDMSSRNGITVNGNPFEAACLMPGDVLGVASHRFAIDYEPQGDAPPPVSHNPFSLSLLEKLGLEKNWTPKTNPFDRGETDQGDHCNPRVEIAWSSTDWPLTK